MVYSVCWETISTIYTPELHQLKQFWKITVHENTHLVVS